ncbi:hypothetical protein [Paenibacillus endoradicis]|uniref:hypothetical protein n=1 Tax=Paenibacillus endoradicis TaxID=2972487 RepID=UPI002159826C|nr:hypothetical protein [Paenibacillus endoradicis]
MNNIAFSILVCVTILIVIGLGLLAIMNRSISEEAVNEKIEKHLTKIVENNDSLSSVLLTIQSNQTGYFEQFAVGTRNQLSDQSVQFDSQYQNIGEPQWRKFIWKI